MTDTAPELACACGLSGYRVSAGSVPTMNTKGAKQKHRSLRELFQGINVPNEDIRDAVKVRRIRIKGSRNAAAERDDWRGHQNSQLNSKASPRITNIGHSFSRSLVPCLDNHLSSESESKPLVTILGFGYGLEVSFAGISVYVAWTKVQSRLGCAATFTHKLCMC